MPEQTRPCEYCGTAVTRTGKQQSQRKYWTCGRVCANKLRIKLGNTPTWQPNPYRGQKDTRSCAICAEPVTRYVNEQNHDRPWTCSFACMGAQQRRRLLADGKWSDGKKPRRGDTVPCSVCGTPFYRQPAYIKQGRHLCSRACNKAWQSRNQIEKTCPQCGRSFGVARSEATFTYCSQACYVVSKTKGATGRIHNGRPVIRTGHGYLTVYEPVHPAANRSGRVLEHRLVMERKIGRLLLRSEHVNHVNHVRDDNRPENLEIMTASDHGRETNDWTKKKREALDTELIELRAKLAAIEAERAALNDKD